MQLTQRNGIASKEVQSGSAVKIGATKMGMPIARPRTIITQENESTRDFRIVFIMIFCVYYILVAEITLVHFQTQVPPSIPL